MSEIQTPSKVRRELLQADCDNCFGLCCVALAFEKSADFVIDKDAGEPCTNLKDDFRCGIHARLRESGFKGCTVYECFGAGQKISQISFGGRSWRQEPDTRDLMFGLLPIVRQLHELLWYLHEASEMLGTHPLRDELVSAYNGTEVITQQSPKDLRAFDIESHRERVNALLSRVSEIVRTDARVERGASKRARQIRPGADLLGAQMSGEDLRGSNLRGACVIAADLSTSFFLTQSQLNSAKGDAMTKLPAWAIRPAHWSP